MLPMRILLIHTTGTQHLPINLTIQSKYSIMDKTTLWGLAVLDGLDVLDGNLDCFVEGIADCEDFLDLGRWGGGQGVVDGGWGVG